VTTELEDAQGTFTLSPAPTNGFDPRIDSLVTLASAPTAALIDTPSVEIAAFEGAAPAEAQGTENRTGPETATLAPTASEVDSQGAIDATTAEPVQATVTAANPSAPLNMGTLTGQITGLAFQLGSAIRQPAIAAGQNLADRLFQTLVPGSSRTGTCPIFIEDTIERTLANEPEAQASVNALDSVNWDEIGDDLDWQGVGAVLTGRGCRCDGLYDASHDTSRTQHAVPDEAAVDQYFIQTADNTDQATVNE
jgi:hypothetical protein